MRLRYTASRLIQENSQFTVWGPLIWYESAQVRLWIILNININDFHHMGMSQMCTGADHYFRPSKPHSGKLWTVFCILIDAYLPIFKVFIKQLNNVPIPYSWLISVPVTSFIVYTLHLLSTYCWSNSLSTSISICESGAGSLHTYILCQTLACRLDCFICEHVWSI